MEIVFAQTRCSKFFKTGTIRAEDLLRGVLVSEAHRSMFISFAFSKSGKEIDQQLRDISTKISKFGENYDLIFFCLVTLV